MNTMMRSACALRALRVGVMAVAAAGMCGWAAGQPALPTLEGHHARVYAELPEMTPWGLAFSADNTGIVTNGCEAVCDVCATDFTSLPACSPWKPETPLDVLYFVSFCHDYPIVCDRDGLITGWPGAVIIGEQFPEGRGALRAFLPPEWSVHVWSWSIEEGSHVRGLAIDGADLLFTVDHNNGSGELRRIRNGVEGLVTSTPAAGPLAVSHLTHDIYVGCEDGKVRAYSPDGWWRFTSVQEMQPFPPLVAIPAGTSFPASGVFALDTLSGGFVTPTPPGTTFALWAGEGFTSTYGSVVLGPGGALYVVDSVNKRVIQFAPEGIDPVITRQPVGRTACLNEGVSFSVEAQSALTASPMVTWFFRGSSGPAVEVGSGPVLSFVAVAGKFGTYYAVVTDCQGGMTVSQEVRLQFAGCVLKGNASEDAIPYR